MADRTFASLARKAVGPLALFLIVTGFFWKLLLTDQYNWLETPDLASQVLPWYQMEAQQFHAHRFPMWDPFLYAGQSLIGQVQPGLAYPLNWILFSLPLDDGHISLLWMSWYFMLIHYMGALFCYLLARDLGRGVIGSILAGIAFGLAGYVGATDWPAMLNGAVWAPLVFLFLFRAAKRRGIPNAALSGLFLGLSWLGGHHQIPLFITLAAVGVWIYFIIENRAFVKPACVFVVVFVLTSAFQTWPAYEYGKLVERWVNGPAPVTWNQAVPYVVHQKFSLSPIYLLGTVIPGFADNGNPFVGIVALSLVALAVFSWWKLKEIRILFFVGIAGLLLALAKDNIFHGLLYSLVPVVEKARSPAAFLFLFHFAVAVLAAFGLDALFDPANRTMVRRLAIAALCFGTFGFFTIFGVDVGQMLDWKTDDRVMMTVLASFGLAVLLYRVTRHDHLRYGIAVMIAGLYMIEIGNVSLYALPHREEDKRTIYLKHYAETKQVAEFLRRQPWPLRVEVSDEAVPFNFGDWYGIDTLNGYTASVPVAFDRIEPYGTRAKKLFGTGYAIGKNSTGEGQEQVFHDDNGLIVFKNPNPLPRVWVVHEAVKVKDSTEARKRLEDPDFDLQRTTFGYANPPRLQACDGDTVQSFDRGLNYTTVVVDMKCDGMVIESENDAPGWGARIDGKKAAIYEAYTLFRGVAAPAGRHRIEMRYRPVSVYGGAAATLCGLLIALGLCFMRPRARS